MTPPDSDFEQRCAQTHADIDQQTAVNKMLFEQERLKVKALQDAVFDPSYGLRARQDRYESKLDTAVSLIKWILALAIPSAISLIGIAAAVMGYFLS